MTKDIQTILDRWTSYCSAKYKWEYVFECNNEVENIVLDLVDSTTRQVSFNDILLDSNLFECLFGDNQHWNDILFQSKTLLPCSYTNIPSWKFHKWNCILLDTQEQRVKYILDNLQKKE